MEEPTQTTTATAPAATTAQLFWFVVLCFVYAMVLGALWFIGLLLFTFALYQLGDGGTSMFVMAATARQIGSPSLVSNIVILLIAGFFASLVLRKVQPTQKQKNTVLVTMFCIGLLPVLSCIGGQCAVQSYANVLGSSVLWILVAAVYLCKNELWQLFGLK